MSGHDVDALVTSAGQTAKAAATGLSAAADEVVTHVLEEMATRLTTAEAAVLAANDADVAAARSGGMADALIDRLRLSGDRLAAVAAQLRTLAAAPIPQRRTFVRELDGELRLELWRRPVGVIGATFEARPNVVVDIASQLLRSGNTGVLRTGGAALRSCSALVDEVIAPSLRRHGLPEGAIQLLRTADRAASFALARHPEVIPLVIIRGSGETTRLLGREAAAHGVRALAHADGGGVIYLDRAADPKTAVETVRASLDRLGVCNRLNLLLVDRGAADSVWPDVHDLLDALGITQAAPGQSDRPRGHEWANDPGHEATVTVDWVDGADEAAAIANDETSAIAASILTEDADTAGRFLRAFRGTGAFWNATTRWLDGYRLLGLPETGINVDHVPGPRGPVTFHDLHLRQYVVVPTHAATEV
ncbi:aldehyde dehydrogenase family protein [Frankia sp. CiP3]|uniref:aldehyde dehydrogenase family protein n=1 Tax=Frankia sp. CiP3 TaxID=2880971 RepID=UPI001EF6A181|nr:aldehyde dehydrogenase family protein [Frankia sp. CiP3]